MIIWHETIFYFDKNYAMFHLYFSRVHHGNYYHHSYLYHEAVILAFLNSSFKVMSASAITYT